MISNHVSGVAVKITRKSGQEDFKLVAYNRCPLRQVWLYAEYGAKKRGKTEVSDVVNETTGNTVQCTIF